MPLDGLSRRLEKLEALAGGAGVPCEKCGQDGAPFGGRDRGEVLREAERDALTEPNVVEARAITFNCQKCGRPRICVMQHVANRRPFDGGQEA